MVHKLNFKIKVTIYIYKNVRKVRLNDKLRKQTNKQS